MNVMDKFLEGRTIARDYMEGNTRIIILEPNTTPEEKEEALREFHRVAWDIWQGFTTEKKIEINNRLAKEG